MPDRPSVGFIGVGNMGWPMAACLHRAGFALSVHDARREGLVLKPLAEAGRASFLFTASPLPVVGGTGGPIGPTAVP